MAEFDAVRYKAIERETYSRKARSYEKHGAAIFELSPPPSLRPSSNNHNSQLNSKIEF